MSAMTSAFLTDLALCEAYLRGRGLTPVCDTSIAWEFGGGPGSRGRLLGAVAGNSSDQPGVPVWDDEEIARALSASKDVVWITRGSMWSPMHRSVVIESALRDGHIVGDAVKSPLSGSYYGIHLRRWGRGTRGREVRGFVNGFECGTPAEFSLAHSLRGLPDSHRVFFEWCRTNMPRIVQLERLGRVCYLPWLDIGDRHFSMVEIGHTYVRIRLAFMATEPPFDDDFVMGEFVELLRRVPGLDVPAHAIHALDYEFPLMRLDSPATAQVLLQAFDWAVARMEEER